MHGLKVLSFIAFAAFEGALTSAATITNEHYLVKKDIWKNKCVEKYGKGKDTFVLDNSDIHCSCQENGTFECTDKYLNPEFKLRSCQIATRLVSYYDMYNIKSATCKCKQDGTYICYDKSRYLSMDINDQNGENSINEEQNSGQMLKIKPSNFYSNDWQFTFETQSRSNTREIN
ncbi:hypothetical protein BB561_003754 [Smittium simulii]|uniref:Cyanovirin-N domain-containing protein n=1 Tax=Smittium simulii TaxID=133385 RepID=A0A2T9YJT2_9FUNG|nr:hypothetical protein BB561_003754 [Smittium simulii]